MKLPVVPWYDKGLSFQCTQCGNCCTGGPGYVWVSDVEIDRFAAKLQMDRQAFIKKHCRVIGDQVSLKERKNLRGEYDCVFLQEIDIDEGGRIAKRRVCTAYEVRPLQCRTWPFWDGLLSSKKAWESAKERCPGIDRGKAYSRERIEALRDATDWPDAPPGSK
ncbi:MAG: YkgJ family cysteine cluster protein [Tepidisphaeraceae bacterium]